MVTDATKKYREPIAFALLGVAALWFVAGLSLLFKNADVGFATRASLVGGAFTAAVPVLSLVVAVFLVTRFGGPSPNARNVVLVALGIVGLDLLFAVITFFAQFGSDQGNGFFGVVLAGKAVGGILGLAGLTFLGVAAFYVVTAFQGLPAPAAAQQGQWGGAGYAGYAGYTPGAEQPPAGQQAWAQPDQGYAQSGQPGWGQPPSPYGWVSPEQAQAPGWGQQAQGQGGGWGQPAAPAQSGWGQQSGYGAQPPQAQQWAAEPPASPQPGAWAQPAAAYGDAPTSFVETGSDPAWTDPAEGSPMTPDDQVDPPQETAAAPHGDGAGATDDAPHDDTPESDSGWWQHPQR